MARIRTIKPEFWESESIAKLSFKARLLFICIWNNADDKGRFRWNATYLLNKAFMYDNLNNEEGNLLMNELVASDLVVPYESGNCSYAYVKNWVKHQTINRPQPSKFPDPEEFKHNNDIVNEDSLNNHEQFSDNSLNNHGTFTVGREGKGIGKERSGVVNEYSHTPSFEKIEKELTSNRFIELTSMNMVFDYDSFKAFVIKWLKKKKTTEDYNYPIGKLKTWVIDDFQKLKSSKATEEIKPKKSAWI